jgi:DNA-binding transcriptional LysR family regulator
VPTAYPAALGEAFCAAHTPSGQPIRQTREVHTITEVRTLVASGRIVWPAEASMVGFLRRDDIVLVPISDLPPTPVSLIWYTAQEDARIRDLQP